VITNVSLDSQAQSRRYVLLTGATGLLGSYVMRDLFLEGCHLAVIVRPTKRMSVQNRIESIMQRWESDLGKRLPRPVIFEGDVCQPNLGLKSDEIRWISQHCDSMIHCAAVLQFEGTGMAEEPWRTNLGGTRNVLDLTRQAEIRDFHYVSTAYVCGQRDDLVSEDQLDRGQEFRNDYERSKFQAESLVDAADHFESKTVYRPAVIVGDSQTGFTSTYHGLYLYLRLISMLIPEMPRNEQGMVETPVRLPGSGEEPRNLVPVDWVSRVITHLFCTPEARGKNYHLAPNSPSTVRELTEYCYEYFNSCGVQFAGNETDRKGDNEFSERYFENVGIYESYETSDPSFCTKNVAQFAGQFPCPNIDKAMTLRFIEFGIADRWGKRPVKIPPVEHWFENHLSTVAESATNVLETLDADSPGPSVGFGLDIRGPGGGQWQITVGDNSEFQVAPGLPDDSFPVLKLDDQQVNKLLAETNSSGAKVEGLTTVWSEPLKSVLAEVSRVGVRAL
jgi:thioester reductase-like protein